MSHFTVLVRVPSMFGEGGLKDAVAKSLAPYQENNNGDCPREYLDFHDEEDEMREEYETESCEMVEVEDGKLVYPWDERFRVPRSFGTGGDTHKVPAAYKKRDVTHRERFATFEEFMAGWHGSRKRDKEKKRYGYWENPNKKWDWWSIGGRWGGSIPIKDGAKKVSGRPGVGGETDNDRDPTRTDACRLVDVDWDRLAVEARKESAGFWEQWLQLRDGKEFPPFDGPREMALNLGYVECKDANELTDDDKAKTLVKWRRQLKEGVDRFDVLANPTEAQARQDHETVYGGLHSYAFLDASGWHSPGEMGWFGMSSDTPSTKAEHAKMQARALKEGDQRDWVVMVDCHI